MYPVPCTLYRIIILTFLFILIYFLYIYDYIFFKDHTPRGMYTYTKIIIFLYVCYVAFVHMRMTFFICLFFCSVGFLFVCSFVAAVVVLFVFCIRYVWRMMQGYNMNEWKRIINNNSSVKIEIKYTLKRYKNEFYDPTTLFSAFLHSLHFLRSYMSL